MKPLDSTGYHGTLPPVNPTFHTTALDVALDLRFMAAGYRYLFTGARAGRHRPRL